MHDEFKGFSCHENKYLQWIDVGTFGGRLALGMRGGSGIKIPTCLGLQDRLAGSGIEKPCFKP